jgi:hypothetical protein
MISAYLSSRYRARRACCNPHTWARRGTFSFGWPIVRPRCIYTDARGEHGRSTTTIYIPSSCALRRLTQHGVQDQALSDNLLSSEG